MFALHFHLLSITQKKCCGNHLCRTDTLKRSTFCCFVSFGPFELPGTMISVGLTLIDCPQPGVVAFHRFKAIAVISVRTLASVCRVWKWRFKFVHSAAAKSCGYLSALIKKLCTRASQHEVTCQSQSTSAFVQIACV